MFLGAPQNEKNLWKCSIPLSCNNSNNYNFLYETYVMIILYWLEFRNKIPWIALWDDIQSYQLSSSGPWSHILNGKRISEKKSNLQESQKGTRADAIIQKQPPTHPPDNNPELIYWYFTTLVFQYTPVGLVKKFKRGWPWAQMKPFRHRNCCSKRIFLRNHYFGGNCFCPKNTYLRN